MIPEMSKTPVPQQKVKLPRIEHKAKQASTQKKSFTSMQGVTAKSWLYHSESFHYGYKSQVKRQIASLTKIMTTICTLELCKKYKMNSTTTYFKVTEWAAKTNGTTANLIENSWISIQDLLFGLMLPSGNDAAMVLAQNLGAVIYFDKAGSKAMIEEIRSIDLTEDKESIKLYMSEFVLYMNEKCFELKLYKTRFSNPHGMDMVNNYSCCEDVLLLSKEALKNQTIKDICNTKFHKGSFKFFKEGKIQIKQITWLNTNKLLGEKNIFGLKTGITNKAGGCLATTFKLNESDNKYGIVIVLGCFSTEMRFKDTLKILKWVDQQAK